MLNIIKKKYSLKAAIEQADKARNAQGLAAEKLYINAYKFYAEAVKNDFVLAQTLYKWGFSLLRHAELVETAKAVDLYREAIDKFNFCLLIDRNYLGAAIDGGVCYMRLAQAKNANINDKLYSMARQSFNNAERIQQGSAAFNIACIFAMKRDERQCLEYLELAAKRGSLPGTKEIMDDVDLATMQGNLWFDEFIEKLANQTEKKDTTDKYEAEGIPTKKVKKDTRAFPETEVNGKVYNVEGDVIRVIGEEKTPTDPIAPAQTINKSPSPQKEPTATDQTIDHAQQPQEKNPSFWLNWRGNQHTHKSEAEKQTTENMPSRNDKVDLPKVTDNTPQHQQQSATKSEVKNESVVTNANEATKTKQPPENKQPSWLSWGKKNTQPAKDETKQTPTPNDEIYTPSKETPVAHDKTDAQVDKSTPQPEQQSDQSTHQPATDKTATLQEQPQPQPQPKEDKQATTPTSNHATSDISADNTQSPPDKTQATQSPATQEKKPNSTWGSKSW